MNQNHQGATPPLQQKQTAPLKNHPGPRMPSHVLLQQPPTVQQTPWRLRVQISGDSHNTVGLEVKDQILIHKPDKSS